MKTQKNHKNRLDDIDKMEEKLYAQIDFRRKQLQKQIDLMNEKYHCQDERIESCKNRRIQQQTKHPINQRNQITGYRWKYVANCIEELNSFDLDDFRQKQYKRMQERQNIHNMKKQRQNKLLIGDQQQNRQQQQIDKNCGLKSNQKKKQIPWKLMRKLRQHDVRQNKNRIQNASQYQKIHTHHFHK